MFAEQLGGLVPHLGGPAEAHAVLGLLAALAGAEETVVRGAAVASLRAVVAQMGAADVVAHAVPVLQQLATGEWFTTRLSAAALFPALYGALAGAGAGAAPPETRASLRALFATLTTDETPMVRRAAAEHIGALSRHVEHGALLEEVLPRYLELCMDDQDSVRLLALENAKVLGAALSPGENAAALLPMLRLMAADKSWRLRQVVARDAPALTAALGGAGPDALLPLFEKLLADPESEVRAAAMKQAAPYLAVVGFERFQARLLPGVSAGLRDPVLAARLAAAEALVATCLAVGRELSLAHVLPLMISALHDDASDVRMAALAGLGQLAPALSGAQLEEKIVPCLEALGKDRIWRVRERVILQLPAFARSLVRRGGGGEGGGGICSPRGAPPPAQGSCSLTTHTRAPPHPPPQAAPAFQEKLLGSFLECFQDQVFAVRHAAAGCVSALRGALGEAWALAHVLPHLAELFALPESSYLQRITALSGMRALCEGGGEGEGGATEATAAALLPHLLQGAKDEVPNVRAACAEVLGRVGAMLRGGGGEGEGGAAVAAALAALGGDGELEVRHAAAAALERMGAGGPL